MKILKIVTIVVFFLLVATFFVVKYLSERQNTAISEAPAEQPSVIVTEQMNINDIMKQLKIYRIKDYPAPDFTLKDLEGSPVRLSYFRGKFVLLAFFTTW